MAAYLLGRILYGLSVLFGVLSLVFFLFNTKPGDPARLLGGQFADEQMLANIKRDLGLDLPLSQRYLLYLNDISPISYHQRIAENEVNYLSKEKYNYSQLFKTSEGAVVLKTPYLRRSYQSKRNVSEIISESIGGTAILAFTAIVIALVFGIFLGIVSALYQNSFLDQFILFLSVLGMSGPSFFVAIILSWLGGYVCADVLSLPVLPFAFFFLWFTLILLKQKKAGHYELNQLLVQSLLAFVLGYGINMLCVAFFSGAPHVNLPGTHLNMTGSLYTIDPFDGKILSLKNLILPAITLGIRPLAVVVQLTRSALLDVLEQDYIRTARAKGLSENQILYRHALKNALNPVVTAISGWFASMLAGAVFIEFVFGWKGLGLQVFEALEKDDLPVVTGAVLFFATIFVAINVLVDWIYGLLDPRVSKA